jgi:ABC-type branched-subunit amino acid transport system ATPase component
MGAAISLSSAVALVGRFPVLAGVDFAMPEGSVTTVLGANGAGKTSLLRLLGGLQRLDGGSGTVLGFDLSHPERSFRRRVGFLGHDPGLYEDLTAQENINFALKAVRLPLSATSSSLERCGISGRLLSTPVKHLSQGQRRRVGLAKLVARRPPLWLLDEPHASLDEATRVLVGELVEEAASGGASIVATSHEPEYSVPMADLVVTMGGGVIVASKQGGRHAS